MVEQLRQWLLRVFPDMEGPFLVEIDDEDDYGNWNDEVEVVVIG